MTRWYYYIKYILFTLLIGLVAALVVVGSVAAVGWHYRARIAQALLATIPKAITAPSVPLAPALPAILPITQTAQVVAPTPTIATAVAKVNKSVVSIQVAQPVVSYSVATDGSITQSSTLQTIGGGSGFFVSDNGLILTNKHVVNFTNATFTVVTVTGKKYPATVVAKDPTLDIALLKINTTKSTGVIFGDSDKLQLGQSVIAIGYALGQLSNSISAGIVSGLGRSITAGDKFDGTTEELSKLIQTDAAINPGNSGGPLLTIDGTIIGVNVATATGSQSIGFALPINSIKAFVSAHK